MNTRGFLASGSLLLFALPRENAFLSLPAAAAPRLAFKRVAAIKEDGAPATPATPAHDYFDLVVLGAGPVGVSAALAAADLGKRVCLVDAPAYSGALLKDGEDLSLGGPTGLFSKALRDTSKRLSVSTLRGMGISEKSIWSEVCCATPRMHTPRSPLAVVVSFICRSNSRLSLQFILFIFLVQYILTQSVGFFISCSVHERLFTKPDRARCGPCASSSRRSTRGTAAAR